MTKHEVNIAALDLFADALRAYPAHQAETLAAADRAIERARDTLMHAEDHWRRVVERCRNQASACLAEAAFVASQGGYLNCSAYEYALYDAEESLQRVVAAQWRFEDAIQRYRGAALRYGAILEDGIPRAVTYVETCITLYTDVVATTLHAHPALTAHLRESVPPSPATTNPPTDSGTPRSGASPERGESVERREGGPEQRG